MSMNDEIVIDIDDQDDDDREDVNNTNTTNNECAATSKKFEATTQLQCRFAMLGGAQEQVLLSHIFPYLGAKDIVSMGTSCKYFLHLCVNPTIWDHLVRKDFYPDDFQAIELRKQLSNFLNQRSQLPSGSNTLLTRCDYVQCMQDYLSRRQAASIDSSAFNNSIEIHRKLTWWESFLDISLFRVLIVMPAVAIFLSMLFLCLHFDGVGIPIWVCSTPVLFLFFYTFLGIILTMRIYEGRHQSNGWVEMWENLHSPIKSFYMNIVQQSKGLMYFTFAMLVLMLLQVLLISVKLSTHVTPYHIRHQLVWGLVFLPLWCLLTMFCVAPVIGMFQDKAFFVLLLITVWIPLFVIVVCLVVKLDGEDAQSKEANIRLALIFIPLWVMEGFVLLSTVMIFIGGCIKYRRGFYERGQLEEVIGLFFICWILICPPVIFQSMLSALDDHGVTDTNSHAKAIIPLLLLIGVFLLGLVSLAVRYKSPYNATYKQRAHGLVGALELFPV